VVDGAAKGRALPAALFDVTGAERVTVEFAVPLPVARAQRFAVTLEGPAGALSAGRRLEKAVAVAEVP
jgi:hypothetical protein